MEDDWSDRKIKIKSKTQGVREMKGCMTSRKYKYGLKEMFAIKCIDCGKKRTFGEFFNTPLGLCEKCDIEDCKEMKK